MKKFRKKPVVVDAVQYNGGNGAEIMEFTGATDELVEDFVNETISIHTLEGVMTARRGDWVIRGVKGEFYPCKPDIFEQTYEAVDG